MRGKYGKDPNGVDFDKRGPPLDRTWKCLLCGHEYLRQAGRFVGVEDIDRGKDNGKARRFGRSAGTYNLTRHHHGGESGK